MKKGPSTTSKLYLPKGKKKKKKKKGKNYKHKPQIKWRLANVPRSHRKEDKQGDS
jgi:hypothetical protein